jgi:hypothetical protein
MRGDERVVLEDVLDERTLFAPFGTGILGEDAMTPVGELLRL